MPVQHTGVAGGTLGKTGRPGTGESMEGRGES